MSTQTFLGTLVVETCCNCGLAFGLEASHQKRMLETHGTFYCPAGHGQHYTAKSEAEIARDALAREKHFREQVAAEAEHLREQRNTMERRLNAQRGVTTRIKNRVRHGVCPCCKRMFQDLSRHMAGKHPTYGDAAHV